MTESHTELLLLPDGRIVAHNLTPAMAALLHDLELGDRSMTTRALSRPRRQRKAGAKQHISSTRSK
jgi:hypothetical protein